MCRSVIAHASALLILLFLSAASVDAGLNRWTATGPSGGALSAFAPDAADPSVLYAATAGGGVFRFDLRGGAEWLPAQGDLPVRAISAIAASAGLRHAVYVGTHDGRVFRSRDGAARWAELEMPRRGEVRRFAFQSAPVRTYIASAEGLFVSSDDGDSWRVVDDIPRDAMSVAAARDSAVYVATPEAVYASDDGGMTWRRTSLLQRAVTLAVDAESGDVYAASITSISVSSDAGTTWRTLPPLGSVADALLPSAGGVYAATANGVYLCERGSVGWTRIGSSDFAAIALTRAPDGGIIAATRGGIVRSDGNGGWRRADRGMQIRYAYDIVAAGEDRAFVSTNEGVFRTADGGDSWRAVTELSKIAYLDANGGDEIYASGTNGIHRSVNGGETWTIVSPRVPIALAVSKSTPATLYASFSETLISRSDDGGRTWNSSSSDLPFNYGFFYYGLYPANVEADTEDGSTAYVTYEAGLFKTADGANSWKRLLGHDRMINEIPTVAGHGAVVHVGLKRGLITSVNGGASWSDPDLTQESVTTIAVDLRRPWRSYAGTSTGAVYRTDDFGGRWTLFNDGLPRVPVYRLAVSESGERVFAATGGGVYVYEIATEVPTFERLPDDETRLPALIRQLTTTSTGTPALILPAAGTVRGSGGLIFRTDVTLSNLRSKEQDVLLAWLPNGNTRGAAVPTYRLTLPPSGEGSATIELDDIAVQLGVDGLGSLALFAVDATGSVDGEAGVAAFARIRTVAACGRGYVSQSFQAVTLSPAATRRARAVGLLHEQGYRTNVGVVNLGEAEASFTVTVQGPRYSERFTMSVPAYASLQVPIPSRNYGAVAIEIAADEAARWVAYGSSVDNASGDSWSSAAVPLRD